MALSRLFQPKSSLQICRLRISTARTRCFSSLCSNGDNDNPPQLKKEVVAEETGVMAVEPFVKESSEKKTGLFSKATFIRNEEAAYGGSNKVKSLTDLFREHKDDQTETTMENEGTQPKKALLDVLLSFAEYRNTEFECLSHSCGLLPSGPATVSQDGHLKEFPLNKCENDLPEYQNARYEGGERSSLSNSIQKVLDLKDDQGAGEIDKPRSLTFTHERFERSNETSREEEEKLPIIKGLIDFIRLQEDLPSNSTNCCNNMGLKENSLNANLLTFDNNDKLTSLDFPAGTSRIEDEETSKLDFKSIDFTELKTSLEVSFPTSNKDQRQLKETHLSRKAENKVLVRFLRSYVTENHILQYFNSCGEILKVEFPYAKGHLFKTAYIYFKTREGLTNALKKSGPVVGGVVTVESATSMEKRTLKIPIPSLIGDPDIPAALVKNPTRTIKIEQLTREISSYHIEEALAFCESNVSGYFLGSSHSVAYVEFETEIGKERALRKQSINVLGRHLVLLRIDSPRTTVVRISSIHSFDPKNILSICRSLGDIRLSFRRSPDMLDVHFGIAEWPNMLKILNRLNGFNVEGRRLQAEPATVYPPDVLLALWHQPEERKCLKATARALLHKLGKNALDTSDLTYIENAFVDKI
ncbi:hypothetical protein Pfo_016190 [Paulownia fortunei]|nr:hypothetical protein Pfo_016190 [Paulownia fortunei]